MTTLDIISTFFMAGAVVQGLIVSVVSWLSRKETSLAKLIFSLLISAMSLTLLYATAIKLNFFLKFPHLHFFPIYYTYAFGPLLFYYVKATLYKNFSLKWSDLKHFLLALAQVSFFAFMLFKNPKIKIEMWENDFSLLYGTFGYPIYLLLFTVYSYFAYRFIKFKQKALAHVHHTRYEEKHVERVRKMVKGLYFLLMVNSSFVVSNFLSQYFLHYSLNYNTLYLFFSDCSFAAMILWVGAYGYYRVMRTIFL
ncbi:MAG: hypothetical protein ACOYOA_07195 [Saprospiraceae bacterium]